MVYHSQYCIANVGFHFCSDIPLVAYPAFEPFATNCTPDFIYEIRLHDTLPNYAQNNNVKYYYDHVNECHYAVTEELRNKMIIHISRKNLPWGTELQHLYKQFALQHALLLHKRIVIHASYISTEKGAILFTAPSGTGKSTQAELWKTYRNASIINGDRAIIAIENAIPTAYGYPHSGSSEYCINQTTKLRAIVSLKQSSTNSVRQLPFSEQLQVLINGSFLPQEYAEDLPLVLDAAMPICQNIPILELSCRPDEDAVIALSDALNEIESKSYNGSR